MNTAVKQMEERLSEMEILKMQQCKEMYPLGLAGDVQARMVFALRPAQWNRIVFICLLMQKSAFSPQLLGCYVKIDRLWPTLSLSEVVLFSLGRDTANCSMFATSCMSVSYLSSSFAFLMFKAEFGRTLRALRTKLKRGNSMVCQTPAASTGAVSKGQSFGDDMR